MSDSVSEKPPGENMLLLHTKRQGKKDEAFKSERETIGREILKRESG